MSLEGIFPILNQMESEGVIGRYAIGGAVGAIFWLEPFPTRGLDVFVTLPTALDDSLLAFDSINEYLLDHGYRPQEQLLIMGVWSVEFVPPATPLVEEA